MKLITQKLTNLKAKKDWVPFRGGNWTRRGIERGRGIECGHGIECRREIEREHRIECGGGN